MRGLDSTREGVGSRTWAARSPWRRQQVQAGRRFSSRQAQLRRLTVGGFLKPFETPSLRRLFVSSRGAQFKALAAEPPSLSRSHVVEFQRSCCNRCTLVVGVVDKGGRGFPEMGDPGPWRTHCPEPSGCPPRTLLDGSLAGLGSLQGVRGNETWGEDHGCRTRDFPHPGKCPHYLTS